MIKFSGLTWKTYSYLIDDRSGNEKAKGTKKWVIKRKLNFEGYKKVPTKPYYNHNNGLKAKCIMYSLKNLTILIKRYAKIERNI